MGGSGGLGVSEGGEEKRGQIRQSRGAGQGSGKDCKTAKTEQIEGDICGV